MDHRTPHKEFYGMPLTHDDYHGMPYRSLGDSGLRASQVGLGTWKIGYPDTGDGARVDEASAFDLFDRAMQLGVTFWDTANRYNESSGNSERIIGSWLKKNPQERRNIVLATKAYGAMDGKTPNHSGLSRLNILESVYASLDRLQTDAIDLLYFHRYDASIPAEESLLAIEDLVRQDLIRYLGVSNFSVDQLKLYQALAEKLGSRAKVVAVQNRFDMLSGEDESLSGVLDHCARANVSYVPYSPLARGLLSRRYLDREAVGPGHRLFDEGTLEDDLTQDRQKALQELARLAQKWEMELSQLALAYTLTLPGMGPVIPSASNVKQLEMNAAAGKIKLDEAQILAVQTALQSI